MHGCSSSGCYRQITLICNRPSALHRHCICSGGTLTYLGDEDAVASVDAHGEALAVLVEGTGANSEDLGLVEVLNGGLGKEDAGGSLGLGLDALDEDAVKKGDESLDGADGGGLWQ